MYPSSIWRRVDKLACLGLLFSKICTQKWCSGCCRSTSWKKGELPKCNWNVQHVPKPCCCYWECFVTITSTLNTFPLPPRCVLYFVYCFKYWHKKYILFDWQSLIVSFTQWLSCREKHSQCGLLLAGCISVITKQPSNVNLQIVKRYQLS